MRADCLEKCLAVMTFQAPAAIQLLWSESKDLNWECLKYLCVSIFLQNLLRPILDLDPNISINFFHRVKCKTILWFQNTILLYRREYSRSNYVLQNFHVILVKIISIAYFLLGCFIMYDYLLILEEWNHVYLNELNKSSHFENGNGIIF